LTKLIICDIINIREKEKKGYLVLIEWYFVLALVPVYIAGGAFTLGARLWPRWRDAEGRIRPNPLHVIEAIFWPAVWPIWAVAWYYWWQLRGLWWLLRQCFHIAIRLPVAPFRLSRQMYRLAQGIFAENVNLTP
jgi:hypothetical protein